MRSSKLPAERRSNGRLAAVFAALTALTVLAGPVTAAPEAPPDEGTVKVIVTFEGRRGADVRAAIESEGGSVGRKFQLIKGFAASVPAKAIDGLRRNPHVASVELDHQLVAFDHGAASGNAELEAAWGVEHIGAGQVHASGNTGAGVKVGVIDSGIDYNHPDLNSVYAGGWDFYNNDADPMDDNGHGTHVAGSLAAELNDPAQGVVGAAPETDVYAYKVLNANGEGDYSGLIAALERATLVDEVDVVNMSLGAHTPSDALAAAVAAAYNTGTVLVAASGNVNPLNFQELLFGCPVAYPAAYPQVFATTFTGQNDQLTGYSCTGPQVDFAAPGDLINSTVPTGTCMFCAPSGYRGDMSGTSMAAPHLAGTVALVLAHGIENAGDSQTLADDVKTHLCSNTSVGFGVLSTPIPPTDPRYPNYFGCGVTDANRALITNPPPGGGGGGGGNAAPVAADDSVTTNEDAQVAVDVRANDTDADGDPLAVTSVGTPAHGTASVNASGSIVYRPAANFHGTDSFTYDVSDGQATDSATVDVTVQPVNDPPVAANDTATTAGSTTVVVPVLANDSDVDGDALAVSAASQPAHGTATIVQGGVAYTPAAGYTGSDAFGYTVSDGHGGTALATVTVTVRPQMHVGDLDRSRTRQSQSWTARVTIRVHSGTHGNVSSAVVRGSWSTGATGSCTTSSNGTCTISRSSLALTRTSVTFSVTGVTRSGRIYVAAANHDPDGDSNGTSIVVPRP